MTSFNRLRGQTARPVAYLLLLGLPFQAHAVLGLFEHGAGIAAMGFGGVSYAVAMDSNAIGANPAHAAAMERRFDLGISIAIPEADGRILGNALDEDSTHDTGNTLLAIPQGGWAQALGDRWSYGTTLQNAGIGPSYSDNPYQRFGSDGEAELSLGQMTLVNALAYRIHPDHTVAAALNISYQTLEARGLGAFAAPEGSDNNVSVAPSAVTNRGTDGAWGLGFSLGWSGHLSERIQAGAAYRSPTWTQKHRDYKGLLPEGGRLELPAIYGAGLAMALGGGWRVALEYQHYAYESQKAFGNRLSQLADGNRLGSENGPGFGFRDQDVLKLGVDWQATPRLALRAGFVRASQIVRRSETLFSFLGAVMNRSHYTLGAAYTWDKWELSGYFAHAPESTVRGEGSIPDNLGGGEADVSFSVQHFGLSLGHRFGR